MARLIQTENGNLKKQFFINSENTSIGRSEQNTIHLEQNIISSHHAEIFIERDHHGNEVYFLIDLNSKNGTFINKDKISCKHLTHKDRIQFAQEQFIFIDDRVYLSELNNENITQ